MGSGGCGVGGAVCGVGVGGCSVGGVFCGVGDCSFAMVAKGGTKVEASKKRLRYQCQCRSVN